jgi:hypothetical protein
MLRRGAAWAVGVVAVAAVVAYFAVQAQQRGAVVAAADRAARAAGCTGIQHPPSEGRSHQPPFTYDRRPATSGPHSAPLPPEPAVHTQPVPEENAVHNLEHAYVLIYYRKQGDAALPEAVVRRLEGLAESEEKVLMAPYPDLPEGRDLALAAWTRLQTCPSTITPDQAEAVARGFIARFRGGGDAPEPNAP